VEQNVQATRYAYSRGAASLLEVLDALRAQQDVTTDYSTSLHDYWVSVYALRAVMSTP
jgi:outer membrane protein TolC